MESGRLLKRSRLTLRVLRTLTRLAQADLLTLDFTGVTSDVAGLPQRAAQGLVVLDQGASDAVTDCTSLPPDTTTSEGDESGELLDVLGQVGRLTKQHAGGFAAKELIQAAVVDGDVAST